MFISNDKFDTNFCSTIFLLLLAITNGMIHHTASPTLVLLNFRVSLNVKLGLEGRWQCWVEQTYCGYQLCLKVLGQDLARGRCQKIMWNKFFNANKFLGLIDEQFSNFYDYFFELFVAENDYYKSSNVENLIQQKPRFLNQTRLAVHSSRSSYNVTKIRIPD